MTSTAALLSQQTDPSALTSICRPLPGYRLAFIPITKFLEQCFTIVFGASFRTARPMKFTARDLLLPFLGSEEIDTVNQFKALKKQIEWMAGRLAAKQLARHLLDHQPELRDTRIAYRQKGVPYLENEPSLSLSISHSGDYAVAGLGLKPTCVLGLDLEKVRPASRETLLRTAFTKREAQILQDGDDHQLFKCWTAKEAYLKYIGQGFHESLKKVEIINNSIFHHGSPVPFLTVHSHLPLPGYAFSMVC